MSNGSDSQKRDVLAVGEDIVSSRRFAKAEGVIHHSKEHNIAAHSVSTAVRALEITRWLNRRGATVDEKDVIRAALLHDIGMTEDSVSGSPSPVRARSHPREGERIAREEFGANDVQLDAIRHHMWPLCLVPPRTVEGWVVVAADKQCSVREAIEIGRDKLRAGRRKVMGRKNDHERDARA